MKNIEDLTRDYYRRLDAEPEDEMETAYVPPKVYKPTDVEALRKQFAQMFGERYAKEIWG